MTDHTISALHTKDVQIVPKPDCTDDMGTNIESDIENHDGFDRNGIVATNTLEFDGNESSDLDAKTAAPPDSRWSTLLEWMNF